MVITTYICDRCKKEINLKDDDFFHLTVFRHFVPGNIHEMAQDICSKCLNELETWIRGEKAIKPK